MDLQLVGCNHQTCPLALREQLAISAPAVPRFLDQFHRTFPDTEVVLLSTCNRLELYTNAGPTRPAPPAHDVLAFLAEWKRISQRWLDDTFYRHQNRDAVCHLFLVASSLDSMILGESQILRQVKKAYEIARRQSTTGPVTNRAFQAAIHTARRIARETELFRRRVSIPRLAVCETVREILGDLRTKRIAVLGAGEMAVESLRALRDEGARQIVVLNHREERARKLSDLYQVQSWSWQALPTAFAWADLIVTATSAPTPLVSVEQFRTWAASGRPCPLVILDLGVPRDIDPQVGDESGVALLSIDDLRERAERNRRRRESEIPQALEIIDEEAGNFVDHWNTRATGAWIRQLQALRDQAQDQELRRLFHQLPNLDEESRQAIQLALHRFAGKLLHPIMTSVRQDTRTVDHVPSKRSMKSAKANGC